MRELDGRLQPICRVLKQTEAIEMKRLVGHDNYKEMLADLVNYSAVTEWDEDGSYTLNALKRFEKTVYKLIVAANTDNNTPDCSTEWVEAPIFNSDCFNHVWYEGGLRTMMAWYVYAAAAPFYPQILNVAGFTPNPDSSLKDNLGYYLNHVYKEIAKMKQEFTCWYNDDAANRCMVIDACLISESGAADKNRTHRKIAW